jgi:hypothetical protein
MLQHKARIDKIKNIILHIDVHYIKPHEMLYLKRALAAGLLRLASRDPEGNEDCEKEQAAEALDLIIEELEEYF